MMKLNQLVKTECDIEIRGVSADSRDIKSGFLYGSLSGDYVADALQKGAVAIIVAEDYNKPIPQNIAVIKKNRRS